MINVSLSYHTPSKLEIILNQRAAANYKYYNSIDRKEINKKLNKVINLADEVRSNKRDKNIVKKKSSVMKKELRKLGTCLFEPLKDNRKKRFKDIFYGLKEKSLQLNLDNGTRMYPWELMFDGKDFLCNKYAIGRTITTENFEFFGGNLPEYKRALIVGLNYDKYRTKLKLEYPEKEAKNVCRKLEKKINTTLLIGEEASLENVKKELVKGVDIFHFTGHGFFKPRAKSPEQSAGICLSDGDMDGTQFNEIFDIKDHGAPFLSVMNACVTAREKINTRLKENDPYGLAEIFIRNGAEAYIGTFWPIDDEISYRFCTKFYDNIIKEKYIGESLREARLSFKQKKSKAAIDTWPAYVLFGDPNVNLVKHISK